MHDGGGFCEDDKKMASSSLVSRVRKKGGLILPPPIICARDNNDRLFFGVACINVSHKDTAENASKCTCLTKIPWAKLTEY